jgi:hypothetical protein
MNFTALEENNFVFMTRPDFLTYIDAKGELKKSKENYAVRRNTINKENMFHHQNKDHKLCLIFTGKTSNITVLDIDAKEIYEKLIEKAPALKEAYTVETLHGYHLYFNYDPDIKPTRTNVFTKWQDLGEVDIRNDNDIITAQGSTYNLLDGKGSTFTYKYLYGELGYDFPKFIKKFMKPDCFFSNDKIKEESESEEAKEEIKEEVNDKVLKEIETKVLKMGNPHFDSYEPWLELCFIIHTESKGSKEGEKLFINLCEKVCSDFNKRECISKWQSAGKNPKANKKTMGTLNFRYAELFPEEKKDINEDYQKQKKEFEKTVFRINSPFKFVNIKEEGEIEFMNEDKLRSFAKNQKKIKMINDKGHTKETPFINLWLEDEKQKTFNKIVFDPSTLESNKNYNFWKGFKYKNYEVKNFKEEDNKFLSLLKKIVNDNINYEYIKQWIAHIIQQPHIKTKVALVFYSDTKGVGKNCLVDGIKKLLEGYTAKMNSIEDLKKTFNIHLVNKLLISGDEICAKARGISDLLKETITRTEQNAEPKGKDATQIDDYTNWIFTTNNYNAFYIEEGDRRFNMIHCLEEQLSNEASTAYKAELENEKIMNDLFNYLRTYKITYKIGTSSDIPLSSYKRNLQFNSKPAYIEVLYKQPHRFSEDGWSVSEYIKHVNEYCKINHLRACPDNITIGKFLTSILKDYKKRGDCGYIYNLSKVQEYQLNELLFNYDKAYFRFCHNMEDDEEPVFKPPEQKPEQKPAKGTKSDLDH